MSAVRGGATVAECMQSELKGVREDVYVGGYYNDGIRIQELGEMALNTVLEPKQGEEGIHIPGVGNQQFSGQYGNHRPFHTLPC